MIPAIDKIRLKLETPWSIFVHKINKIILGNRKADTIKWTRNCKNLRKKYFKNGLWNFNGIKLPDYTPEPLGWLMYSIYMDSLFVFCRHQDNYRDTLIDTLDKYLPEGTYGYKNDEIDVTVKPNDVVIDAGAWIGDFSAYAAYKGAKVYAFEPSKETIPYLQKTLELNSGINIVEMGLGDQAGIFTLEQNTENSGANRIVEAQNKTIEINVITIDEFIALNNINRIDFIKADIEGYERNMLLGAKDTLRNFAPKLAICTYHLPDDPQVLSKIILEANPNYRIVQKRKKLYAMVEKSDIAYRECLHPTIV